MSKLWDIWAAPGNRSHRSYIRLPAEFEGGCFFSKFFSKFFGKATSEIFSKFIDMLTIKFLGKFINKLFNKKAFIFGSRTDADLKVLATVCGSLMS